MVNDARVSRANAHNLPVHPQRDVSAVDASISDRIEMVAGAVPFCFPASTVKPLMVPGVHDSETVLADGMLSVKLNCAEAHLNSQSRRPGALGACSRSKSSSPASESAAASSLSHTRAGVAVSATVALGLGRGSCRLATRASARGEGSASVRVCIVFATSGAAQESDRLVSGRTPPAVMLAHQVE
jgi:hypothetical protein